MRPNKLLSGAIAVGLMTTFAATSAHAILLYDTIHTAVTPGSTQIVNPLTPPENLSRGGPIAIEFNSGSATTLGAVQLQLSAITPLDGGTLNLYLVNNNSGSPFFTGTGASAVFTTSTFTPLTAFASVPDSKIALQSANPQGGTITVNLASLLTLTANTEYWIGLTNTVGGGTDATAYAQFDHTSYTSGIGTAGQSDFFQAAAATPGCVTNNVVCGAPGVPVTYLVANGQNVYEAAIFSTNVPEPASLAILGAGLTGLGVIRRRRRKS